MFLATFTACGTRCSTLLLFCPLPQAKRRVSSSGSLALRVLSLGLRGSKSTPAVAEVAAAAEGAELHDEVVARCSGNWLSHLDWGAERCGHAPSPCPAPSNAEYSHCHRHQTLVHCCRCALPSSGVLAGGGRCWRKQLWSGSP